MFSVSAALDAGIHSFALVHDSLGTHAGKTEEFFHIIRQKFYDLYANNTPLETFREHITPQIPEGLRGRIPDIPHIGTLDIKDVLDAEYLFS
jgi:DNA-directed RNA polymerase